MNDHFWKRDILISFLTIPSLWTKRMSFYFFSCQWKDGCLQLICYCCSKLLLGCCFVTVWISFCNLVWLLGLVWFGTLIPPFNCLLLFGWYFLFDCLSLRLFVYLFDWSFLSRYFFWFIVSLPLSFLCLVASYFFSFDILGFLLYLKISHILVFYFMQNGEFIR